MVALLPCALFAEDCGTVAMSDSTVAVTEVVADTLQAKHPNRIQRWRDKLKQKIAAKLSEPYDTVRNKGYWWRAMKHGKVNFKDSTMGYPKFVRFCYRVYVWGDKAFNSYDSTYVVPTGKLWKLTLKNQNWIDNFMGSNDEGRALFTSGMSSSIGFYLSFMAVSVGYSLDLDRLFGGKNTSERMEFSFTCARFTAEVHKSTNSGKMNTRIKLAGSDWVRGEKMRALRRETKGLSATYFFNSSRYARAAAYCYSKYQRRSAGSPLVGLSVDYHDFKVDAKELTEEQSQRFEEWQVSRVRYTDYCLSGGYAYNWVINRKLLLNATGVVGGGLKHIYSADSRPSTNSGALKLTGNFALTYNHKRYFASLQTNVNSNMYLTGSRHFSYTTVDLTTVFGIRF